MLPSGAGKECAAWAGVSLQYIEEVEQVLGFFFTFPSDFKEFYTVVDGFPTAIWIKI